MILPYLHLTYSASSSKDYFSNSESHCVIVVCFEDVSPPPPQVETVFGSPNMTVAYHVTGGDSVYPPSVVLDALESYGRDKLIADLRQYLPMVTALPIPVASWKPNPTSSFQLKTGERVFI